MVSRNVLVRWTGGVVAASAGVAVDGIIDGVAAGRVVRAGVPTASMVGTRLDGVDVIEALVTVVHAVSIKARMNSGSEFERRMFVAIPTITVEPPNDSHSCVTG